MKSGQMSSKIKIEEPHLKKKILDYYNFNTKDLYMELWSRDHLHFGCFEPGECPEPTETGAEFRDSPGFVRALARMVDVIIAPADIGPDSFVVDAGCGIGGTALHLARKFGCRVMGVNIVPLHIDLASKMADDEGLSDLLGFRLGDCSQHLPAEDNSVDVVINIESACHYIDRQQFLREVYRILKPGGKIVASDWLYRDGASDEEYEKYIRPITDSWALPSLECQSSYVPLVKNAGFRLLSFGGFDGKDADNIRIFRNLHQFLLKFYMAGVNTPEFLNLFEKIRSLYIGWRDGFFELGHYVAEKPK